MQILLLTDRAAKAMRVIISIESLLRGVDGVVPDRSAVLAGPARSALCGRIFAQRQIADQERFKEFYTVQKMAKPSHARRQAPIIL